MLIYVLQDPRICMKTAMPCWPSISLPHRALESGDDGQQASEKSSVNWTIGGQDAQNVYD